MHKLEKTPILRGIIGIALCALVLVVSANCLQDNVLADEQIVADASWGEMYPDIYASYMANAENNYTTAPDYLENDPYLKTIYEGYGFAKDYKEARGHNYCLEDVRGTERPHATANCLTCKTADFTVLVNNLGKDAYSMSFDEASAMCETNVGCYNCHANNLEVNGDLIVTHDYIAESLGTDSGIDSKILACGQCHIEYYFNPADKATSVPYTNVEDMDPVAILDYYNEIGFSDWTQESTGAKLLKAQHPEMETYLAQGSRHNMMGLTCASCHMEKVETPEGNMYTSHKLVSPLESETILATCTQCHGETNMVDKVHTLQEKITARETVTGNALAELKEALAAANQSGDYTEEELDVIRDLYRSAQWFFDFDYVENSEGAHNSTLANSCLDKADDYISQANALFK